MKSFFNHTLLILTVIVICSLAILFRGELLAGYEKTQISIPAEQSPAQSIPIPASIRSSNSEFKPETRFPGSRKKIEKAEWEAENLSDYIDAPESVQKRLKENIRRSTDKERN